MAKAARRMTRVRASRRPLSTRLRFEQLPTEHPVVLLVGLNGRTIDWLEAAPPRLGGRVPAVLASAESPAEGAAEGRSAESWLRRHQVPIAGTSCDLPEFLRTHCIEEVVVTLSLGEHYEEVLRIVDLCEEAGIRVSLSSELFDRPALRPAVARGADGRECLSFDRGCREPLGCVLKRALDIVGSLAALAIFAIPMLVIALLIKITSPDGPIFFVQERCGIRHRRFRMYKFRTMVPDAEQRRRELAAANEMDGPVFKMRRDPRVTPLGRLLRKTSLDELPQLFNVLRGDMSLVGPRPPLPSEVAEYEPWMRRRLSVTPGITCTWQVSGRNGISFEQWMRMDLEYIDNWSVTRDVFLLVRTVVAVLSTRGAS